MKLLIEEIRNGNCVAFVGSGFSAPVVPTWGDLLLALADVLGATEIQGRLRSAVDEKSAGSGLLEASAQMLQDEHRGAFFDALREVAGSPMQHAAEAPRRRMEKRRALLGEIPFLAVLTTNFDGVLEGTHPPSAETYTKLLRGQVAGHWWDEKLWRHAKGTPVVKLHGDVSPTSTLGIESLVFSRRDYRQRLHRDPAYLAFLRTVFTRHTVLYLGFSFTDAYVNRLRSEVLSLLDRGESEPTPTIAYALLADTDPQWDAYMKKHEGIEVLPFASKPDFEGFDVHLEQIHAATSTVSLLGERVSGKAILWVDGRPENNLYGIDLLRRAGASVDTADGGLREALERIASTAYDLVITRWGFVPGAALSEAEMLLLEMGRAGLLAPVLVFASDKHADENKKRALAHRAVAYSYRWPSLLREIHRVFAPGVETM